MKVINTKKDTTLSVEITIASDKQSELDEALAKMWILLNDKGILVSWAMEVIGVPTEEKKDVKGD